MDRKLAAYFLQSDETYYCDEHAELCDTKTLGIPYLPEGDCLPTDDNGDPMTLLFQINFEEFPTLPGFPEAGMMQIFVADTVEESGMHGRSAVCVRFYDSIDYDAERPEGAFFTDEDNRFGLSEGRYEGSGAVLEMPGDDIGLPLGETDFPGIIVGGRINTYPLSEDSFRLVENDPEYCFPLLRISPEETVFGPDGAYVYFLVDELEFEKRDIHQVLVLFDQAG